MSLVMKKILTAIAAFLYIGTSTGAMIHQHYCMGKLADWRLGYSQSKTCGGCGMDEDNSMDGCCKDEHTFIKNDKDQKAAEYYYKLPRITEGFLLPGYIEPALLPTSSVTEENPLCNAPPRSSGLAVYLINRILLI